MSKIVIIEGGDNLGKSSQIKRIFKILSQQDPTHITHCMGISGENARINSEMYYKDCLDLVYWAVIGQSNLIFDRSWIGEACYAPMYRNYSGDYVFELEKDFVNESWWNNISLITFIDTPENMIKRDDGLSFTIDPVKKQEEIDAFIRAHELSSIVNKKLINIEGKNEEAVWKEVRKFLNI